jgi:His/Glu/Gln/Arg/opine family amino acid ABC transporter permease subunit
MALDFGVFCKSTLDGEVVDHCFSSLFGLGQNADPSYLDWLMKAWGWTLAVAALGLAIALIVGAVMGTLRTLPDTGRGSRTLVRFATAWVELFRNIPVLVQVFLWYHVIPSFIFPLKELNKGVAESTTASCDINFSFFRSYHLAKQAFVTIAVVENLNSNNRDFGSIFLDDNSRINSFQR